MATSRLNAAIANAAPGGSINTAFQAAYSDGGLFGFSLATSTALAGDALMAGAAEVAKLAAGDFSDEDAERGKRQAKAEALMLVESVADAGKALAVGLLETKVRSLCASHSKCLEFLLIPLTQDGGTNFKALTRGKDAIRDANANAQDARNFVKRG